MEDVGIEPMSPSEALMELTKHSFLLDIEAPELIAHHFDRLAEMVRQPVFFKLDYPRRYEDLGRVRQAILDDLGVDP